MQVVLETDRLRLRRFTADDIDLLVDLDSDPDVKRYIDGGNATSREEVEGVVLPRILSSTNGSIPAATGLQRRSRAASSSAGSRSLRTKTVRTAEGDVEYAITRADWEP
jgi:hypothetical protein